MTYMKLDPGIFTKKFITISIAFFIVITGLFSVCVEEKKKKKDLSSIALRASDVDSSMEPFSEEHVTTPYVVEQGKLFQGNLVLEKYEIVFMKNANYFLVQQLAMISSVENATMFLDTLQENDTIPGFISDYVFTTVATDSFADQSVLKTSTSIIDDNETVLNMLVFRKDDTVAILVSGTLDQETILSYGRILESRLITWKSS